ncbi:MAG: SURF1 family protein [Chloroflexota bacterium]|nr:SURF1 family protein [Chloroflexota bacterium]
MIKTLFSKRYIFATLFVLLAMFVMIRLGVWQLDRRQQRLASNADVTAKLAESAQSVNDALAGRWTIPEERDTIRNTRATATGQFDYDNQILLLQQPVQGRPGMHLIAPLMLGDSGKAILVDRGWIPEAQAGNPAQFNDAPGEQWVTGFLQPPQILFGRAARKAAADPTPAEAKSQWYRVDIDAIQHQMPYELLPVFLTQSPPPEGNLALPTRVDPEFDLSEGSHLNYAFQWFSFALVAGIIYVSIVRSREKKRQQGSVEAPGGDNPQEQPSALGGTNHV